MNVKDIKNSVGRWLMGGYSSILPREGKGYFPNFEETRQPFAQTIFMNIVERLTDLTNDTTLILKSGSQMRFSDFKVFFEMDGQLTLNRLFNEGFAIIAYGKIGFTLLDSDQYTTSSKYSRVVITDEKYKGNEVYVLKSTSFRSSGKSDRVMLSGFLQYLDNVLNASNTTTARLGSMVMAVPTTGAGVNTEAKITDLEKFKKEVNIGDEYGALKSQRQIMIWPRQMAFTVINLAGLDAKTIDKAKFAINVICDRLAFPSNQVSVIDASNVNSLSNGGEIKEGDILKYKTFERLLQKTFIQMAKDIDLNIDYMIYNKPKMEVQPEIQTI